MANRKESVIMVLAVKIVGWILLILTCGLASYVGYLKYQHNEKMVKKLKPGIFVGLAVAAFALILGNIMHF